MLLTGSTATECAFDSVPVNNRCTAKVPASMTNSDSPTGADHAAGRGVVARAGDLGKAEIDVLVARVPLALLGAVGGERPAAGTVEHGLAEHLMVEGRDEGDERRRVGVVDHRHDLVHGVIAH